MVSEYTSYGVYGTRKSAIVLSSHNGFAPLARRETGPTGGAVDHAGQ